MPIIIFITTVHDHSEYNNVLYNDSAAYRRISGVQELVSKIAV